MHAPSHGNISHGNALRRALRARKLSARLTARRRQGITSDRAARLSRAGPAGRRTDRAHRTQATLAAAETCAQWSELARRGAHLVKHFASEASMSAAVLLVSLLAPALLLQPWRRPKPARIAYPRRGRAGGTRVR